MATGSDDKQSCAHNCATVCTTRVPSWQRAPHRTRRLEWGAAASSAAQTIAKRVIDGNGQPRSTTGRTMHTAVPQSATQDTKLAASAPPHAAARMGCCSQQCRPNHHQTGDRWQRAAMTSRTVRTTVPQSAPQEYQAGSERPTARGG